MTRIRVIYEIFSFLSSYTDYKSIKEVSEFIEKSHGEHVSPRRIKQYMMDIQKELNNPFESRRGQDGGWRIKSKTKNLLSILAVHQLNDLDRNALNDAFEIAEKSKTFFYFNDLKIARNKMNLYFNLKDHDFEYYLGAEQHNVEAEQKLKLLKKAAMEYRMVKISSKYKYYNVPIEERIYEVHYIIHDSDETFIVLKRGNDYLFQNLLNIKSVCLINEYFNEKDKVPISSFINKNSLKIKKERKLKFTIDDERGECIYNLWNYEFHELKSIGNKKEVVFYEEYIALDFLLRMNEHITILDINENLKKVWNKKIKSLKEIK